MRVLQLLPTLSYGDAIGNEVLAIDEMLKKLGFRTKIFAENKEIRMMSRAGSIESWKNPDSEDLLIYHMAIASGLKKVIEQAGCRRIVRYHNITPAHFYEPYDLHMVNILDSGAEEFRKMRADFDYGLADSAFNRTDLLSCGYTCPVDVVPILMNFDDYGKAPDSAVMERMSGRRGKLILHVGRIAPNKKIEDVISAFVMYKKHYDPDAMLVLAGKYEPQDSYFRRLKKYVEALGGADIIFTGHISFTELLAYYRSADLYLCMSEHEGFCVPLVESMYFSLPVVAYRSTAVPETLGNAGILLDKKDPLLTAGVMNRVLRDTDLNARLKENGAEQLKLYMPERVGSLLMDKLQRFLQK
ncbi:MAG: glycosyltransferase [Pyramidobacter sp.]